MSQHILQGRTEDEVLWFRRREFLQAAAAWTAMGGSAAAQAQQRSNIVELRGDALLNGQRLTTAHTIQTGDSLETGPASQLVFVVGNMVLLIPGELGEWITKVMPGNAGGEIATPVSFNPDLLGAWTGFGVFALETAALVGVAWFLLRKRDA